MYVNMRAVKRLDECNSLPSKIEMSMGGFCFIVCGMIMSWLRPEMYRVSNAAFTLPRFQVNTDHTVETAPDFLYAFKVFLQQSLFYRFRKKNKINKTKRNKMLRENIVQNWRSSLSIYVAYGKNKEQRRATSEEKCQMCCLRSSLTLPLSHI